MHGLLFPFIKFTFTYLHVVPEHNMLLNLLLDVKTFSSAQVCVSLSAAGNKIQMHILWNKNLKAKPRY